VRYSRALKVGLSLTAGLAVAGTAAGVTYAATTASTKAVYACANKPGTLRLLAKGKCPSGYAKVAINKQGPRGLTGPQGPGAVTLSTASTTNGVGAPVKTVALGALKLDLGVYCKPGTNAALSIGFHKNTPLGAWNVSGLTFATTDQYGLKVNGIPISGGSGSWGFDEAVDGTEGNDVRLSVASGGRLQGSLLLTRDGRSATVEVALDAFVNDACSARAQVTPSG
jgi:hypothetical protein